jgi:membrane protein
LPKNRGRHARRPSDIPLTGYLDVLMRVWHVQDKRNLGLIAAGIAFYGLLSIFPGITAAVALAGIVTDPTFLLENSATIADVLPVSAADIVLGQLQDVLTTSNTTLGYAALFSVGLALFSASKATQNMIIGLNVINGEHESRNFFLLRGIILVMTLAMILALILAVALVAVFPAVATFVSGVSGLPVMAQWVMYLRWPALFLLGTLGIGLMYRYGPSRRRPRWRWVTPGAALATALWVIGSYGFSAYVTSFADYNETFGTLGGVIVLLYWLWLSAFIILLGASVDAEMEAQTRHDSTVGPPRPMGQRGAVKADTLGPLRGDLPEV